MGSFIRFSGASGLVRITAPFPAFDVIELFTMFVAIIFAYMLDPQGKLKGAARRVEILTVQLVA